MKVYLVHGYYNPIPDDGGQTLAVFDHYPNDAEISKFNVNDYFSDIAIIEFDVQTRDSES